MRAMTFLEIRQFFSNFSNLTLIGLVFKREKRFLSSLSNKQRNETRIIVRGTIGVYDAVCQLWRG